MMSWCIKLTLIRLTLTMYKLPIVIMPETRFLTCVVLLINIRKLRCFWKKQRLFTEMPTYADEKNRTLQQLKLLRKISIRTGTFNILRIEMRALFKRLQWKYSPKTRETPKKKSRKEMRTWNLKKNYHPVRARRRYEDSLLRQNIRMAANIQTKKWINQLLLKIELSWNGYRNRWRPYELTCALRPSWRPQKGRPKGRMRSGEGPVISSLASRHSGELLAEEDEPDAVRRRPSQRHELTASAHLVASFRIHR